jgi:hypothetical protein
MNQRLRRMGARSDAPRVLAIADVRSSYVAAWRVHAPLAALERGGQIATYTVTDATLAGLPQRGEFDVVWLQRAADDIVTRRLIDILPGDFLLDVDDHLLCRPRDIPAPEFPSPATVTEALASCRVLTVTSARLGDLLAARAGLDLREKAVVCPNATSFDVTPPRTQEQPSALLLTQGHRLALEASAEAVLTAVGDFGAGHGLPICYFGRPLEGLSPLAARVLGGVVPAGELPLGRYHQTLGALPSLLAVAPLETRGDAVGVEFAAGKSDVKMLEYGGFGHPGVYSDAPPYAESDLRCGRLAANTYEAWTEALAHMWDEGWRAAAADQAAVRRRRDIRTVAAEDWARAVEAARLERPVHARTIAHPADRASAAVRDARARAAWRLTH